MQKIQARASLPRMTWRCPSLCLENQCQADQTILGYRASWQIWNCHSSGRETYSSELEAALCIHRVLISNSSRKFLGDWDLNHWRDTASPILGYMELWHKVPSYVCKVQLVILSLNAFSEEEQLPLSKRMENLENCLAGIAFSILVLWSWTYDNCASE